MENQLLDVNLGDNEVVLESVSQGKRFANYLIDTVAWYVLLILVMGFAFASNEDIAEDFATESSRSMGWSYLMTYSTMIGYYFLCEWLFKGRTLGKLITGCRAVTTEGEFLTAGNAIKRTLSRIVPFEPFSFLGGYGRGWHDQWTETMVVSANIRLKR
jgi:uncharacterized RDD family membrane protein YckC